MDIRIFVTAVVILCSFDVSNALMCYNCTGGSHSGLGHPNCGDKLMNTDSISTVTCSGRCLSSKSSTTFGGHTINVYNRECVEDCPVKECRDVEDHVPPLTVCNKCCSTDLCNEDYSEPVPDSASAIIANIVAVFTLLLLKVML